nr:TNF receptor-associated factor 5-like [Pocillopora verrucosa]XP_058968596.1 TNF receptor-associated factor 5-like [Pocillopora verrucosa]
METWAESTATPLCPQCRATFRKEELRLNVAMDKATRDLPVKCNSQGCQWKGNYSDANDHLRHCPKVRERCPNEGCQHVAAREEMTAHACPKERIACSGCQLSVTRERLQFHRTSLCRNSAVLCPLRCGASLPRMNINLHLHKCPEKASMCQVPGCKKIVKKKDMNVHLKEASTSHFALQSGEIKRLRGIIYYKKCNIEPIEPKVERVVSFCWRIPNFVESRRQQASDAIGDKPLTSGPFIDDNCRWRGLYSGQQKLFLQLLSAFHPVTGEIQIVMAPGSDNEQVLDLDIVSLKEGEMWGRRIPNVDSLLDGNGSLDVKFIIYYFNLY